ncbi:MAG TPA: sigma-54 dependent transcriptional regulator [Polyangiaceae bacterium]|nr:sigma-54 dependent transcriptional regulator [Polyangiaceae bacterium]
MTSPAPGVEPKSKPDQDERPTLPSILVVDDDKDMCELAEAALTRRSFSVTWRRDPHEALALLDEHDYRVLLVDINMQGMNGLELCRAALVKRPNLMVVVMTGFGSLDHAVAALRAGAHDFVTKPVSMDALVMILERAVRHRSMSEELARLRGRVQKRELPNVIGNSEAMRRTADVVNRVAGGDASIFITGESGTGKELIARAIHDSSQRRGPFLAINCAAVPDSLLESELFGYMRGAFTDAKTTRSGLFVEANEGTLFLDEIGEMSLGMQAKLLRVLQERKVRPLGSAQEIAYDARVVTATNRDLEQLVQEKRFREDLFYRINVVRIEMPPLRARGDDVLLLSQFFLERAAQRMSKDVTKFGREVAERLLAYEWPGNVRELENCIERAVALARFDALTIDDLPPKVRDYRSEEVFTPSDDPNDLPPMHIVEERYVRKVLDAVQGNKTLAAKVLGFDRRTLYRKLERMN